jgi:DNA-binding winged helix-turn-helix (wHTH) protein/tetratricopeptide (TPR) repeat protein
MKARSYRFGEFVVDLTARELRRANATIELPVSAFDCLVYLIEHRERPVGRDELISATWGRANVSETLLGHTIVRLRKALGDSARDPSSIRTVSRYGYRWMAETFVDDDEVAAGNADAAAPDPEDRRLEAAVSAGSALERHAYVRSSRRRAIYVVGVLLAAAILLWGWKLASRSAVDPSRGEPGAPRVVVLPTRVDAPEAWAWLRLGMMDLVANHLRSDGLAVVPSETVVHLLQREGPGATDPRRLADLAGADTALVSSRVERTGDAWRVSLELARPGHTIAADARSKEVLQAAHEASDLLLAKLGRHSPQQGNLPDIRLQELLQRARAATLADQLDLARSMIDEAPPEFRSSPEIVWMTALIESHAGQYEASVKRLEKLLDGLAGEDNLPLRGRTLNFLASLYFRRAQYDRAQETYAEAIRLLDRRNEPAALGLAYAGRGLVALARSRFDEGAADLGRARTLYQATGNELGIAQVDLNLAGTAVLRGQLAAAQPLLEHAAERFQRLASQEEFVVALTILADVQRHLLDFPEALATTDRFWPPERHIANERLRWQLTLSRAEALADLGRLREARRLAGELLDRARSEDDAEVRVRTEALLARLALNEGDYETALNRGRQALDPVLKDDRASYAEIWRVLIRALQRSGRTAEAESELARFRAWASSVPDDIASIDVALATAEQAWSAGRHDDALQGYAQVMALAERWGVPDLLVDVGQSYVVALLDSGKLDEASAVSGRIAPWAEHDLRAAWVQAAMYRALGQTEAWSETNQRAQRLAGERAMPQRP